MKSSSVRKSLLALVGLLAVLGVVASASAGPGKGYTAVVGGTPVAGVNVGFKVTLAVPSSEKQQLGSARLTAPADFTVKAASVDVPATVTRNGNTVTIQQLALQPGTSAVVTIVAAVPCAAAATLWIVEAKQANEFNGSPGNDLTLSATNPSLDTPIVGVCEPCPANQGCEKKQIDNRSQFKVTGGASAKDELLTLALGTDLSIDCAGYTEVMGTTALFNVTGDRTKTAELLVAKRDLPRGGYLKLELCFGSPDPFTTKSGSVATAQGLYDWDGDGVATSVYVGLLPDCETAESTLCVTRDRTVDNDGVISARLPEGDPGMRG